MNLRYIVLFSTLLLLSLLHSSHSSFFPSFIPLQRLFLHSLPFLPHSSIIPSVNHLVPSTHALSPSIAFIYNFPKVPMVINSFLVSFTSFLHHWPHSPRHLFIHKCISSYCILRLLSLQPKAIIHLWHQFLLLLLHLFFLNICLDLRPIKVKEAPRPDR